MVALWTAPASLGHTRRPSRKAAGEARPQKHSSAPKISATGTAKTAGLPVAGDRREGRRRVPFQMVAHMGGGAKQAGVEMLLCADDNPGEWRVYGVSPSCRFRQNLRQLASLGAGCGLAGASIRMTKRDGKRRDLTDPAQLGSL